MPNESLIAQIENMLSRVVDIGGQKETTSIVSNLTILDATPAGLTGYITIEDSRDGDAILAKKVPGVGYADTDLVNVLFVRGTEPIAFQQGSQSSGDPVLVSKLVSPDETINPVISADNSGDVTIAGTGDLFIPNTITRVGDPNTLMDFGSDDTILFVAGGIDMIQLLEDPVQDQIIFGDGSDIDLDFNQAMFFRGSDSRVAVGNQAPTAVLDIDTDGGTVTSPLLRMQGDTSSNIIMNVTTQVTTSSGPQLLRFVASVDPQAALANLFGINTNLVINGSTSNAITNFQNYFADMSFGGSYGGTITNLRGYFAANPSDASSGSPVITNHFGFYVEDLTFATNNWAFYSVGTDVESYLEGDTGIGTNSISAKLHVDQNSTVGAKPVLYLDQADVSEEMIEYNTTIGVGNAIEAVGAKTLTPTHFIKVTLPGGLTRYHTVGTIA